MINTMITKIDDQINDPITIVNTMIISASLSISHYQIGNISLITSTI